MAGTPLSKVAATSLFVAGGVYRRRANGDLQYDGVRPAGPHWIAHGYFPRKLFMLLEGTVVRRRLWKRRWLDPEAGESCHSRPPDDIAQVWSCSLIITLMLWAWLDGGDGAATTTQIIDSLEDHVSPRTLGRWLQRAVSRAEQLEQAIRRALIERSEPRPVEHLFPTGLSPPQALLGRHWRHDRSEIAALHRALAFLFGGATQLLVPVPCLLAEARGRMNEEHDNFLL